MDLRGPTEADWREFYRLAELEGWRVPLAERAMFRETWRDAALVLLDSGRFCGLVTAVGQVRSGWIGNLIVPRTRRGRGYGTALFRAALGTLLQAGVETVWLTASEPGRPIYARHGFVTVDRVERWLLPAKAPRPRTLDANRLEMDALCAADVSVWQERRHALLEGIAASGRVLGEGDAVALLQPGEDLQIIGPWYAGDNDLQDTRSLLTSLCALSDPATEVVIDVLASSPVCRLLPDAGFVRAGENLLMAHGDASHVARHRMVALASLGSVG